MSETGKKKLKFYLEISICEKLTCGIKAQDLVDLFKDVGKRSDDKKIVATTKSLGEGSLSS